MNKHYIRDNYHSTPRERYNATVWGTIIAAAMVAAVGLMVYDRAQAAERGTATSGVSHTMLRAGQLIRSGFATEDACNAAMLEQRKIDAETKITGSWRYTCREDRWTNVSYGPGTTQPPVCPAPPADRSISKECPSNSTGSGWTQTEHSSVGAPPACTITVTLSPTSAPPGACTPIVVEPTGTATLTWRHDGLNVDGFRVVYGASATELTRVVQVPGASVRVTSLQNMSPGTYFFAVKAYNGSGESSPSNVVAKVLR